MAQNSFYDIIGGSAVLVALIGIWKNKPDRRLPWLLMAVGQGMFVAGDILWNWYEAIGEDPFPSMADALYLAGYPFIALGLLLLIRRRLGGGDRGGILDAAILTTACATLSWTFFIQPQLVGTELDPLSLAITLAYPVADLLLIGVAMGLLTTPGARTSSFGMLAVSLIALLVADQIYALQNLDGDVRERRRARLHLPDLLHPVRCRGRPPVDAPPDRPPAGRRHVARARPADLPRGRDGDRPGARDPRPGSRRRSCRGRHRDRPPLAPRPGPPVRAGRHPRPRRGEAPDARGPAQLPGLPRPADRAWSTGAGSSHRPRPRWPRGSGTARSPPCSSTSTTSRPSTTASAMPPATSSSSLSPRGSGPASVPRTSPRVSAATSSASCCSTSDDLGYATGVAERLLETIQAPLSVGGHAGGGQREHRHRDRHPDHERGRRPARGRGRRDVSGQGPRQGPPPRLRRQARRRDRPGPDVDGSGPDRSSADDRARQPRAWRRLGSGAAARLGSDAMAPGRRASSRS